MPASPPPPPCSARPTVNVNVQGRDKGAAAQELLEASMDLSSAMANAVSPELDVIGDALAWEEQRRAEGN